MDERDRHEEDDARREAAEAVVLEEYAWAHDKAVATLVAIGLRYGDTKDEADGWARECCRYAREAS